MHAPTLTKGGHAPSSSDPQKSTVLRQQFAIYALNMSWQLAAVVLVPLIGGVELDKKLHAHSVYAFVGLGVALVGSVMVLWRTMQAANRLPVPKLTEAQKRAIKKSYEEEDED